MQGVNPTLSMGELQNSLPRKSFWHLREIRSGGLGQLVQAVDSRVRPDHQGFGPGRTKSGQARQGLARSRKGHPGLEPGPVRTRDRPQPGQKETILPGQPEQGQGPIRACSQAQRKLFRASRVSLSQGPPGTSLAIVRVGPRHPANVRHDQSRQNRPGQAWAAKTIQGLPGLTEPVGQAIARQSQA